MAPEATWSQNLLLKLWYAISVDANGAYSIDRLLQLQHFFAASRPRTPETTLMQRSWQRKVGDVVTLLLAAFSLAVTLLLECIPLQPPSQGIERNMGFSLRCIATVVVYTTCVLVEVRSIVSRRVLPLSNTSILGISLLVAVLDIAAQFGVAKAWAFPIPFTQLVMMPPWLSLISFWTWVALRWHRRRIRPQPQKSKRHFQQLKEMAQIISVQAEGSFLYPIYYYFFLSLGNREQYVAQFFVSLILPALKVMQKKRLMTVTMHIGDLQPLFMALNPELFSAIFTISCMQNSGSVFTTAVLMVMDFAHACYSLFKIYRTSGELDILVHKLGASRADLVDVAAFIASTNPKYRMQTLEHSHTAASKRVQSIDNITGTHPNVLTVPAIANSRLIRRLNICNRQKKQRQPSSQSQVTSAGLSKSLIGSLSSPWPRVQTLSHSGVSQGRCTPHPPGGTRTWRWNRVKLVKLRGGCGTSRVVPIVPVKTDNLPTQQPSTSATGESARSTSIHEPATTHRSNSLDATTSIDISKLTSEECDRLVNRTLRLLRVVETLLLVEYIEVLVPIGYFCYLHVMYQLPNRAFYPLLRTMDTTELSAVSWNLLLFGALQLLSFVTLQVTLSKRFQLSPSAQLVFALGYKRELVASMLTLWITVILQSSVEHLGHDYSFSFLWLHK